MSEILDYIAKNPQQTKRILGLDYEQLQQLINHAENRHKQKQAEIEKTKIRLIAKGGGRKPKLSIADEIVLTLVYLRHLPTFQLLGLQFGVSESTANDIFNYWLVLLGELLPPSLLEQVKKSESEFELVREILGEMELIVDSSEQVRERPGDYEEQKNSPQARKKLIQ